MFPKINPTSTKAWSLLKNHQTDEMSSTYMKDLFSNDISRFNKFHVQQESFLFDYSKNIINERTIELLLELAEECKLKDAISAMFDGSKINETENRAVFHVGLRDFSDSKFIIDGTEVKSGDSKIIVKVDLAIAGIEF